MKAGEGRKQQGDADGDEKGKIVKKEANIIEYDEYLARNNTKFVTTRYRSKERNMNLNCYLTVKEMNDVKDMLNVHRNIEELNDDFLEAF